jgi:hypothetical protein
MIRAILHPLFFRRSATFDYYGPIDDGVKVLSANVKRTVFQTFFHESLVGKVTTSKVKIWRYRPLFHNSFIPVFSGKFRELNGRSVLEGTFLLNLFTRIFVPVWLIAALLFCLFFLFSVYASEKQMQEPLTAILIPFGMPIFAILLLNVGWFIGRYDIPYIESKIEEVFLRRGI